MTLQYSERAIEVDKNYGPTFGGKDNLRDIEIYDGTLGRTSFPSSYNNGNKYQRTQKTTTAFCGNPNSNVFKVL